MTRFRFLLVAALGSLVALAPAYGMSAKKLQGTVGPGFTITLKMGGKAVKSLKAGSYTISVSDKSKIHNFRLKGSGVNKDSGVARVGSMTWKVTFKKGKKYTFVCDPHASSMKGTFTVT